MCAGLFYVVGQLSFGKQYNDFSEFFVGAEVIRKGTDRCSFNAASTCSICTFTPPVLIVLSFLPRMRNWFCPFISAMSLVTSSFSQISGAYITKVFSLLRRICMLSKGVYQSEASGPFSLRRAMCDKGFGHAVGRPYGMGEIF